MKQFLIRDEFGWAFDRNRVIDRQTQSKNVARLPKFKTSLPLVNTYHTSIHINTTILIIGQYIQRQ